MNYEDCFRERARERERPTDHGVVSLLPSPWYEFKIVLLIHWLSTKAKEPSLPYYFNNSWDTELNLLKYFQEK